MEETAETPPKKESWIDFLKFALIAAAIVLPIRLYIAQPFIVSGASMVPTFENGNYLIVDEISYRFEEPKRGDVVIFRFPGEPKKFLIKRIAGLPNETVELENGAVRIKNEAHPDGFLWQQDARAPQSRPALQSITLKRDEYFVLGDNRDESADSRLWGPLKRTYIIGKPLIRLFPVTELKLFPGTWPTAAE
ncbi:MAG: signal peptidase I [Parcubacteria group bacterium Greene0416_79]|nr:MAG: signal peptidase I [Parcubacteria group bacterium Greene0416_79]